MKYIITEEQNDRLWFIRRKGTIDHLIDKAVEEIPVGDLSWGEFSHSVMVFVLDELDMTQLSIEREEMILDYIDELLQDYHHKEYFGE